MMTLKHKVLFVFSLVFFIGFAQKNNIDGKWENIGPKELPTGRVSVSGIGPVEFIRISKKKPSQMLAGSLLGGLFYSEDEGDTWHNSGSDHWLSSGCGWAEFSPEDPNMWFATSIRDGVKGRPGSIGIFGGLYRTKNRGATWELIANYKTFEKGKYTTIYGIRFHPTQQKKLYLNTSNGVVFTEDCTVDHIKWTKINYLKGSIYDLEINPNFLCLSMKNKNKSWQVFVSEGQKLISIDKVYLEKRPIQYITIEKNKNLFYILISFKNGLDEIWSYNPNSKEVITICDKANVSFGSGYTFAINPNNSNEIILGHGLIVKKWLINEQKFEKLSYGYHVDVEHVAFHPMNKNKFFIATHGGIFKTHNGGESWQFSSTGLSNAEVHGLSVSKSDHNQIVVGLNHDGSLVRADWEKNGKYEWRHVNGGDALIPIINPNHNNIIYTSNQYTGGGIYYSTDTAKTNLKMNKRTWLKTAGWSMACTLHPKYDSIVFFNFTQNSGSSKGCIDVVRTNEPKNDSSYDVISNFGKSHHLKSYQVRSLFSSSFHPDVILAYVLSDSINKKGKKILKHRLFILRNSRDTTPNIINNWHELELPYNNWVGSIVIDPKKWNKLYISYGAGLKPNSAKPDDKGMIYHTKYHKKKYNLIKNWDISGIIPAGVGGRYNMVMTDLNKKTVFIATKRGVFVGSKSTLKGGRSWETVGTGLPHCKPTGIAFNENKNILTISLDGRGVWQIDLSEKL